MPAELLCIRGELITHHVSLEHLPRQWLVDGVSVDPREDVAPDGHELRFAWRRGIETALVKHPDEVAPYKLLPNVADAVQETVSARLRLFNAET